MKKSVKCEGSQKDLFRTEECAASMAVLSSEEVNRAAKRRAEEWLTDCYEERVSTEDMMSQIADLSNLTLACQKVIANGGRGGIDGMEVGELREWFRTHYKELRKQLVTGSYQPSAVRGVQIAKKTGGYRQLGIPTVIDRLVQQAIHEVLSRRYERVFSAYSYGFRPRKGAHQALTQASEYVSIGKHLVVDIDLSKFFDEINHDRLMSRLCHRIGDKRVLKLIHRFLKAGLLAGGLMSQRIKGAPQGGPLSPLLSNIVLDELDKELEERGHKFVRYADDVIIMVGSSKAANRVYASMISYMEGQLKLRVNRRKSSIRKSHELNFLGHGILRNGDLCLSKSSAKRLKQKLKATTRRNRGRSFDQIVKEVNSQLRGWLSYFRNAKMKKQLRGLWSWLKHRLRCYRLKQCKRAKGIQRFLRKLGVPEKRSWTTATSRRGWWVRSMTPAAHEGMNNKWFIQVGLLQVQAHYERLHA